MASRDWIRFYPWFQAFSGSVREYIPHARASVCTEYGIDLPSNMEHFTTNTPVSNPLLNDV